MDDVRKFLEQLRGMSRKLHESETKQRRTVQRLQAILDAAVDGIVTITEDSKIAYPLNPAAANMFGYSVDELVGMDVSVLMPEPYRSQHHVAVKEYLKTGVPKIIGKTRVVEGQHRNGTIFPIALAVSEALVDGERLFTAFIRFVED